MLRYLRVVVVLMGVSSLVFYVLAARAPLVSPSSYTQVDEADHSFIAQTSLPHHRRLDGNHFLSLLPCHLHRRGHGLQTR